MFSFLLFWYLPISGCTGLSLLYRTIQTYFYTGNKSGEFTTNILIFGFCFFTYLGIEKVVLNQGGITSSQVPKDRTGLFQDHLSKFIFSFSLGCLLLSFSLNWIINAIKGKKTISENFLGYVELIYAYYAFPGCCFLDLFFTKKRRCPEPLIDIFMILFFLTAFCALEFGYMHRYKGLSINKYFEEYYLELIFRFVFTLLSYFIYDLLVYCKTKKNGQSYNFLSTKPKKPKKPKEKKKNEKKKEIIIKEPLIPNDKDDKKKSKEDKVLTINES